MLSANMEETLLRAYALAQTHRYPFKVMAQLKIHVSAVRFRPCRGPIVIVCWRTPIPYHWEKSQRQAEEE
jgi:hypothetical protein